MSGNTPVRCEAGEKVEIVSKPYLSLPMVTVSVKTRALKTGEDIEQLALSL